MQGVKPKLLLVGAHTKLVVDGVAGKRTLALIDSPLIWATI